MMRFYDNNNNPLAGGFLYTYAAGTTTPAPTYTDATAVTQNSNPIILNARGEASVWMPATQAYKMILEDAFGNLIWTVDQIIAPAPVAVGNMTDELGSDGHPGFKTGTDFTPGVTTSLTLSQNYGTASNLWVAFDAAEQGADTLSLSGTTLTFSAPIPAGITKVFVKGGTALSIGTPGPGTITDAAVAANAGIQSSKLSFTGVGAGSVARTVQVKLGDFLSVKDFGAVGDGVTDDTLALNTAFSSAYTLGKMLFFPKGTYGVREFSPGIGYAILNPGVSFFGEGMVHSQITPLTSMPNTANFMDIVASGGAFLDFMFVRDIMFNPSNGATKYGASAMYWNFQTTSNASCVNIEGVYCGPGNAYSMIWNNAVGVNTQGIPAEIVVERCAFWEGTQFIGGGDSNRFRDCVFRSNSLSSRVGVQFNSVGSPGNAPSCLSIEDCNFDCAGGAITVFGSYSTSIRHNNIEMSAGTGSGSGACVDIDGSTVPNSFASIKDNLISLFGSSTASSAIRVNAAEGTIIDENRLLAGNTTAQGILITANATDTYIGLNEISPTYTIPVNDLGGTGTRGLRKALTLLNGFSNNGGGFATANVIKNKEGRVSLEGTLTNAGAASGTVVCTLLGAFWPPLGHTFIAFGVVGGSISAVKIVVDTSGNLTMSSTGTVTQLSLDGLAFDTNSYIISSN